MSPSDASAQALVSRPKRADARRNYEKVLSLYQHFPNRQALLEALYSADG